jgi:hypothetical protein
MLACARFGSLAVVALLSLASVGTAQTVEWGAKIGFNTSSVNAVPDPPFAVARPSQTTVRASP